MKRKNIIIYLILMVSLLVGSLSAFAEPNESDMLLFDVEILLNDYTKEVYPIYRSPFLDDEDQIKETLKFLIQRSDVKEILKIDGVVVDESEYKDYLSDLDISIEDIATNDSDKYKKNSDLSMIEKDNNNNKIINNSSESSTVDVKIDGVIVTQDIKGYIENGRAVVPFRTIGEGLGVNVGFVFREGLQVVWGVKYDIKVDMKVGDSRAYKNGKLLYMDSQPVIKNNTTYVPIRYFAELFDCEIEWDQEKNIVNILTSRGGK